MEASHGTDVVGIDYVNFCRVCIVFWNYAALQRCTLICIRLHQIYVKLMLGLRQFTSIQISIRQIYIRSSSSYITLSQVFALTQILHRITSIYSKLRHCSGNAMALPWQCNGSAMAVQLQCQGSDAS